VTGPLTPGRGPFDLDWLRREGKRLSNAGRWGDEDELEWDNQRITLASGDARAAVQSLKDGSVPKFLGR
jgi:hypothetical protein